MLVIKNWLKTMVCKIVFDHPVTTKLNGDSRIYYECKVCGDTWNEKK